MAKQPGFLKRGEQLRLQAFLSRSGMASRRAAEEMITHGRVKVNGEEVTAQGIKVTAGVDRVEVDGVEVKVAPTTWVALHKPKGYVTTRQDPYGRKTVYELLPDKFHGLFHVGRLDRDSEGLLLLTNDGDLANRFLHPSFGITKEYDVVATGKPTDAALRELVEGVELEDGIAQAESAKLIGPAGNGMSRLKLVLREGKKREVRRMLEAVGHPVKRLVRRTFGPIELGELPEGKWRVVQPEELAHVRDAKATPKPKRAESAGEGERPKTKAGARTRASADGETRPTRGKAERPGRPSREDGPRGTRGRPERDDRPARGRRPEHDRDEAAPAPRAPVHIDWDAEDWGDKPPARSRGESRPARGGSGPSRSSDDRPVHPGPKSGSGRGADRPERSRDRARPAAGRGGFDRDDRPRRDFQDRDERPARSGPERPARSGPERPARGGADRPARGGSERPPRGGPERPARGGSDRPARGGADRPPRGGAGPARAPRFDRDEPPARGAKPGPGRRPVGFDEEDDYTAERPARSTGPGRGGTGPGRGGGGPGRGGAARAGDRPAGGRPGGRPGGKPTGGKPGGGKPSGGRPGGKPGGPGKRPGPGGGRKGR